MNHALFEIRIPIDPQRLALAAWALFILAALAVAVLRVAFDMGRIAVLREMSREPVWDGESDDQDVDDEDESLDPDEDSTMPRRPLTQEQLNECLESGGTVCPRCGDSEIIQDEDTEQDGEFATAKKSCESCNEEWVMVFRLVAIARDEAHAAKVIESDTATPVAQVPAHVGNGDAPL